MTDPAATQENAERVRMRDIFLWNVVESLRHNNTRWPGLWVRLESLLRERDALAAEAARASQLEEALRAAGIVVDNYGRHWRRDDAYYEAADLIRAALAREGA